MANQAKLSALIEQLWFILEFPFLLDEIEVEIFGDDAAVIPFFKQVRAAVVELYDDPDFSDRISLIKEAGVLELIDDDPPRDALRVRQDRYSRRRVRKPG